MSALDRSAPPVSGALRDFSFPIVDRKQLANGIDDELLRFTMHGLPQPQSAGNHPSEYFPCAASERERRRVQNALT